MKFRDCFKSGICVVDEKKGIFSFKNKEYQVVDQKKHGGQTAAQLMPQYLERYDKNPLTEISSDLLSLHIKEI